MLTFKRTSGIFIPKKYEDEDFYLQIKDHLTRYTKDYTTSVYTTNYFYEETDNGMKIPRFFPIEKYVQCKVINEMGSGQPIEITHNITPKNKTQESAIKHLLSNNGILRLDAGMGKTVISIYVMATLKVKTFILVHRQSLVDQWIERILEYSSIERDDMGILTSSNFKENLSSKKIILCTDQAFMAIMKRKEDEFKDSLIEADFGLLIADEVHTSVGAPGFSICSLNIPCNRIIGLSATPYRWDGNGDIIDYHLGKIFSIESRDGIMDASVVVLLFDSKLVNTRQKYMYWGGQFQRARYLNLLRKSKIFMAIVRKLISQLEDKSREVIFVAERLKLLDDCMEICSLESKTTFTSGVSLDSVLDKQMIFTTPGKMRDGIDISHKDCLVMTSPISNIAQIVGRVVREHENKKKPLIFDMIDLNIKDIKRTFAKRLTYYDSNGWPIKYIHANRGKFNVIEKNKALNLIFGG